MHQKAKASRMHQFPSCMQCLVPFHWLFLRSPRSGKDGDAAARFHTTVRLDSCWYSKKTSSKPFWIWSVISWRLCAQLPPGFTLSNGRLKYSNITVLVSNC